MFEPVALTELAYARLRAGIAKLHTLPPPRRHMQAGPDLVGTPTQWIKCTSSTPSSGLYPAEVSVYDSSTSAWTDSGSVWIIDANGHTPVAGVRYLCRCVGQDNSGKAIWATYLIATSSSGGDALNYTYSTTATTTPPTGQINGDVSTVSSWSYVYANVTDSSSYDETYVWDPILKFGGQVVIDGGGGNKIVAPILPGGVIAGGVAKLPVAPGGAQQVGAVVGGAVAVVPQPPVAPGVMATVTGSVTSSGGNYVVPVGTTSLYPVGSVVSINDGTNSIVGVVGSVVAGTSVTITGSTAQVVGTATSVATGTALVPSGYPYSGATPVSGASSSPTGTTTSSWVTVLDTGTQSAGIHGSIAIKNTGGSYALAYRWLATDMLGNSGTGSSLSIASLQSANGNADGVSTGAIAPAGTYAPLARIQLQVEDQVSGDHTTFEVASSLVYG
jgi:hypothetical protein